MADVDVTVTESAGIRDALITPTGGSVDQLADHLATALSRAPTNSPTFTGTVTVPDASFANAKLANMVAGTIKSNLTGSSTAPSDNAAPLIKPFIESANTASQGAASSGSITCNLNSKQHMQFTLTGNLTGTSTLAAPTNPPSVSAACVTEHYISFTASGGDWTIHPAFFSTNYSIDNAAKPAKWWKIASGNVGVFKVLRFYNGSTTTWVISGTPATSVAASVWDRFPVFRTPSSSTNYIVSPSQRPHGYDTGDFTSLVPYYFPIILPWTNLEDITTLRIRVAVGQASALGCCALYKLNPDWTISSRIARSADTLALGTSGVVLDAIDLSSVTWEEPGWYLMGVVSDTTGVKFSGAEAMSGANPSYWTTPGECLIAGTAVGSLATALGTSPTIPQGGSGLERQPLIGWY